MGATIISTKNQVDTRGLLSKAVLVQNDIMKIYEPDDKVVFARVDLSILTAGPGFSIITIWVAGKNSVPTTIDLIEREVTFDTNAVYIRTNIELSPSEAIFVRSNNTDTIIRITGFEDRTP